MRRKGIIAILGVGGYGRWGVIRGVFGESNNMSGLPSTKATMVLKWAHVCRTLKELECMFVCDEVSEIVEGI